MDKSVLCWIFFGFFCSLLTACFQPDSGCLDIEATNFTLSADEGCSGNDDETNCPCSYPELSMRVNFVFDSLAYQQERFYRIDSQLIQINLIRFYLSGFQLRQTDGDWLIVEDTISLLVIDSATSELVNKEFIDDFQLMNRQIAITLGEVAESGLLDSIRFVVGIEGQANTASPEAISRTSHPLAQSDMHTGNQTDGYFFNQIRLLRISKIPGGIDGLGSIDGSIGLDSLGILRGIDSLGSPADLGSSSGEILDVSINVQGEQFVEVKMPISVETPIAANFSLGTLTINHAKWFDGIKFAADTDAVMIEKIVANTPNVFSISN